MRVIATDAGAHRLDELLEEPNVFALLIAIEPAYDALRQRAELPAGAARIKGGPMELTQKKRGPFEPRVSCCWC